MDIGKMINLAINILLKPKQTLQEISHKSMPRNDIIIYLAMIGFPGLICFILGYSFVIWYGGFYAASIAGGFVYYIVAIIGIIIFGYIINELAPTFKSQQNQAQAFKLVACVATPWLLAGVFYLLPTAGFLSILAAIYGLYIMYLGLPILMGTPEDQVIPYMIISAVIFIVIAAVIGYISGVIFWAAAPGIT